MPKVIIHTNLKEANIPVGFEHKVATTVAETVSYPLEVVYVTMSCGERMSHNGSGDPMIIIDIDTCARFGESTNGGYSLKLMKFFSEELKIPLCRVLIQYHAAEAYDFGYHRTPPEYKYDIYCNDATKYNSCVSDFTDNPSSYTENDSSPFVIKMSM